VLEANVGVYGLHGYAEYIGGVFCLAVIVQFWS